MGREGCRILEILNVFFLHGQATWGLALALAFFFIFPFGLLVLSFLGSGILNIYLWQRRLHCLAGTEFSFFPLFSSSTLLFITQRWGIHLVSFSVLLLCLVTPIQPSCSYHCLHIFFFVFAFGVFLYFLLHLYSSSSLRTSEFILSRDFLFLPREIHKNNLTTTHYTSYFYFTRDPRFV